MATLSSSNSVSLSARLHVSYEMPLVASCSFNVKWEVQLPHCRVRHSGQYRHGTISLLQNSCETATDWCWNKGARIWPISASLPLHGMRRSGRLTLLFGIYARWFVWLPKLFAVCIMPAVQSVCVQHHLYFLRWHNWLAIPRSCRRILSSFLYSMHNRWMCQGNSNLLCHRPGVPAFLQLSDGASYGFVCQFWFHNLLWSVQSKVVCQYTLDHAWMIWFRYNANMMTADILDRVNSYLNACIPDALLR